MRETLAFFGAFNPPTMAHLRLAEFALRETGAERVIFVPSQEVYIRGNQGKDYAYSNSQRLRMLRRAAETRPWMAVSELDITAPGQPRTYDTLCRFREQGITPALLLGSDKLMELETGWSRAAEIAREFGIVCLTRGTDACRRMVAEDPFLRSLSPWIRILETPEETRNISSTAVRERVTRIRQLRAELAALVPPEILPCLTDEIFRQDLTEKGGC